MPHAPSFRYIAFLHRFDYDTDNERRKFPLEDLLYMKIKLHHPPREISLKGPKQVTVLLRELNLSREAHLVICGDELVAEDAVLPDDEVVEIRPVISGG